MSLNGVLEDLPLADVLQFIHLGRRTGTLYMWRDDDRRAEIAFNDGRIVGAWAPGHQKLGDLLISAGAIDRPTLERALEIQRVLPQNRSLGRILVEGGAVGRGQIHDVVRDQVKSTVFDLVTWRQGNFHFAIDELNPPDEFTVELEEVLGDLDLNTQMLLLEATRIFDEKNRQSGVIEAPQEAEIDRRLRRAGLARNAPFPERSPAKEKRGFEPAATTLEAIRCQVISEDAELVGMLKKALPEELIKIVPIRLREAGNRIPGETQMPIVLFDLSSPKIEIHDIETLARTRPTAPVVVLARGEDEAREARVAGAVSVIPVGDPSLVDCLRHLVRVFSHPQPQGTFGYGAPGGLRSFRRVVFDVQSGLLSATMALNLLHVISESVERAVLFLVQGEVLIACGAFGFTERGESLAALTRGLRLPLGANGALRQALDTAKPVSVDSEDALLPRELEGLIGRSTSGQVVIFPVQGAERTVSVIYTDNGTRPNEIQDIKILELATSQVGVAFENELLRQQFGDHPLDPD
jgi:Domain of unknown function (DUF4388)